MKQRNTFLLGFNCASKMHIRSFIGGVLATGTLFLQRCPTTGGSSITVAYLKAEGPHS